MSSFWFIINSDGQWGLPVHIPDRWHMCTISYLIPRWRTVIQFYLKLSIIIEKEDFEVCCLYKTIWDSYRLGKKIMFIKNQRLPGACNRSPGSKLLSITTQLHCGSHLGGEAQLPDTILEEDHLMTIPSKFGSNWATDSRQDGFYVNFP